MFQLFSWCWRSSPHRFTWCCSPDRRKSGGAIAGTYLLYLLFFYVGVMGILTAYAHVFRPVQTSASIGWSTSPYEKSSIDIRTIGSVELFLRDIGQFLPLEGGVVDEDINPTEPLHGLRDQLLAVFFQSNVPREADDLPTGSLNETNGLIGIFLLILISFAKGKDDVRAFLRVA